MKSSSDSAGPVGRRVMRCWTDAPAGSALHEGKVLVASIRRYGIGGCGARWHNGMTWDVSDQVTHLPRRVTENYPVRFFKTVGAAKKAVDAAIAAHNAISPAQSPNIPDTAPGKR